MAKNAISLTAWVVAMCHVALSRDERWRALAAESPVEFYRLCVEYGRRHSFLCRLLGLLPDPVKLWLLERTLAVGGPQHFILRKQAIAKQVHACIADGARQLVVIGAGFDALALTLAHDMPHIACFEIDTPGMHPHKLFLAQLYYDKLPPNFHAIEADLSQTSLKAALANYTWFDVTKPTVFVAEGLTMYLREPDVKTLLADIRSLVPKAFLLFTALERHRERRRGLFKRLRDLFLASNEESFAWSIEQGDMPAFLAAQNYTQHYQRGFAELQRTWRTDTEMAELQRQNGEYLVYAVANSPH